MTHEARRGTVGQLASALDRFAFLLDRVLVSRTCAPLLSPTDVEKRASALLRGGDGAP